MERSILRKWAEIKRRGIYQLLQTVSGMQSERNGKGAGVFRRGIDPGAAYEPDEAFDLTTEAYSDCGYIPSDLSGTEVTMDPKSEERFGIVRISDDDIYDGMRFMPYRVNDKFNVPHNMKNGAETENPEFVDWIDLRAETSYMIFCEIPLDGPMSFVKRPYDSYEDFVNEFRHKMERYLPKDFDWDAHLGRFNYSAYC